MKKIIFLSLFVVSIFAAITVFSQDVSFEIKAAKESWEPSSVTVKKGDKVSIKFTSVDVDHAINMSEFGLKETIIPAKESVTLEFIADKAGTFSVPCTKYCSWRHLVGMRPRLEVKVTE